MKRIVHKAKNFEDAEKYDIWQHKILTPEHRQRIAYLLRLRVYGKKRPDVRESGFHSITRIQDKNENF